MEINRNQYFMIGIVVLALGIQFRLIHSIVLTEETTEFLAKRLRKSEVSVMDPTPLVWATGASKPKKQLEPPQWIGWALLSAGGVLIMHSLAMRRSD